VCVCVCVWLLLVGDGKCPVRLLVLDVATGMWRGRNNAGNDSVMKF